ncbi:ABC transporter substrate-binding protein [Patulibacter sp. SYSU D01012]|uniref:ABC transporter substrate-binding protein n=1 Tax=Patulibacter sp. SYSU D01012 TaxID=2817381 RepID=UPI001B30F04A|nr:ABC transporter substrate-binding protein [Patulibacter sp. SYSU D01012]
MTRRPGTPDPSGPLLSRRAAVAAALAGAASLGLAACGADDDRSGAGAAAAPGGRFPATVEHQYGRTTVPSAPARIVSLGYADHDTPLALGTVPVLVQRSSPVWRDGVGAWAAGALKGQSPAYVEGVEIDFEKVAAARPDLILAVNLQVSRKDYEKLTKLAPTVVQPKGYPPYGVPWDVTATLIGTALGAPDRTRRLVARTRRAFADALGAHPGLKGRTALPVTLDGDQFAVFTDVDARGRFLDALGMTPPKRIAARYGDVFYLPLSPERVDLLDDADALLVIVDGPEMTAKIERHPAYRNLDVVRRGGAVVLEDQQVVSAISAPSVTSIPYALRAVVPPLAKAVAA